jgi:hypothetical protein
MTTHTMASPPWPLDTTPAEDRLSGAALHLYEADFALHIARQSGIAAWVAAAYDRLHEAVLAYDAALAGSRPALVTSRAADDRAAQDLHLDYRRRRVRRPGGLRRIALGAAGTRRWCPRTMAGRCSQSGSWRRSGRPRG